MNYSQQMLVRLEHDMMVKSLPSVSDYGYIANKTQRNPFVQLRTIFISLLHFVIR